MEERQYYLGFSAFPGVGPVTFAKLLAHFGSAKDAWEASEETLTEVVGQNLTDKLIAFKKTFSLEKFIEDLDRKHIKFLCLADKNYPVLLKAAWNPPFTLYVRGNLKLISAGNGHPGASAIGSQKILNRVQDDGKSSSRRATLARTITPSIGIVGTRKITQYGRDVTEMFTRDLVGSGYIIVSGLAFGVDTVAHTVTLDSHGETIAVLGCGVDCCFPSENTALYDRIVDSGGAIVSELPPGMSPNKGSFPARNRIIAGLSQAVLVTEGAADSGGLITADFASKTNRPVFAVPGPITSGLSEGPYALIKKGATLVTRGEEITDALGIKRKMQNEKLKMKVIRFDTKDEAKILKLIQFEPLHIDDIVRRMKSSSATIGTILTMMEVKGFVKSLEGGFFTVTE